MNYFPSKKIFILLAILALGGGLWWLTAFRAGSANLSGGLVFEKGASVQAQLGNLVQKDSDGDGLVDWEETLWKTDPKNRDTDGDGTTDGDEVKLKRNPLVPGPDDALPEDFLQKQAISDNSDQTLTQTQLFTRDLVNTYLKLKETGQFTPENQTKLVDSFTEEAASRARKIETPAHTVDELFIEDAAGIIPVSQYAQKIEFALGNNLTYSFAGKELALLKDILEKKDSRPVTVFGEAEKAYRNLASALLSMKVPRDIAATHVALINSALAIAKNFSDIQLSQTDPLQALISVKRYSEEAAVFGTRLNDISAYLLSVKNEAEKTQP